MSVSAEIGTATLCLAPERGAAEGGLRASPRRRQSEPTSAFGPPQSRLVPARATPYPSRSEALRQAGPLPRERGEGRGRGPVTGRSPEVSCRRGPGLCFQVAARWRPETPGPQGLPRWWGHVTRTSAKTPAPRQAGGPGPGTLPCALRWRDRLACQFEDRASLLTPESSR